MADLRTWLLQLERVRKELACLHEQLEEMIKQAPEKFVDPDSLVGTREEAVKRHQRKS